jgi:hypothetical protein
MRHLCRVTSSISRQRRQYSDGQKHLLHN